jgi:molecular chaperone GrpE
MENTRQPEQETNKENIDNIEENQEVEAAPESFETIAGEESAVEGELERVKGELAEAKDKYLRMYSEFENFRRRTSREKLELIQSAGEQVIGSLLPILDDFERAEKALSDDELKSKEAEGFLLIHSKFKKMLEQAGVKEMDLKQGSDFDADVHEAISQIPAPSDKLKGKIVDVVEKGYLLNDKVIRFAKVVVGN